MHSLWKGLSHGQGKAASAGKLVGAGVKSSTGCAARASTDFPSPLGGSPKSTLSNAYDWTRGDAQASKHKADRPVNEINHKADGPVTCVEDSDMLGFSFHPGMQRGGNIKCICLQGTYLPCLQEEMVDTEGGSDETD